MAPRFQALLGYLPGCCRSRVFVIIRMSIVCLDTFPEFFNRVLSIHALPSAFRMLVDQRPGRMIPVFMCSLFSVKCLTLVLSIENSVIIFMLNTDVLVFNFTKLPLFTLRRSVFIRRSVCIPCLRCLGIWRHLGLRE